MAAFESLDWGRFDVWGIVFGRGLATVEHHSPPACEHWLRQEGCGVVSLDFADGIGDVVVRLGEMLDWRGQFGYELTSASRNLNALRDGFEVDRIAGHCGVLVLRAFSTAWQEDAGWSRGFLNIVRERSLRQLAVGRRFFGVVGVPDADSALVGQRLRDDGIPGICPKPFR